MSHPPVSVRTNALVFLALLVLLFATVEAAFLPLGQLHLPIALAIAAAKAVLIGLIFMHIYFSRNLTWIVPAASLFWLGMLVALTVTDYLSRGWVNIPGK
jgi:cytochrome c oxidase subunit 4